MSKDIQIEQGIVAIVDHKGAICGTGFLVADKLIVTCAHVVTKAGSGPGQRVTVYFRQSDERRQTTVLDEFWRPQEKGSEDVAILEVDGKSPDVAFLLPLGSFSNQKNLPFLSHGYPLMGDYVGIAASGTIESIVSKEDGRQMLQITSQHIDKGFSGAPVWDKNTKKVVGMFSEIWSSESNWRHRDTSFATLAETLVRICPLLQNEFCLPVKLITEENAISQFTDFVFREGENIQINNKDYLIREISSQKNVGNFFIQSCRASELIPARNVGIRQVEALTQSEQTRIKLRKLVNEAQIQGQEAGQCGHIPVVYDISTNENTVWVISEWINGKTLDQLMPKTGPLPDRGAIIQLLNWSINITEALSALHNRRISHSGVNSFSIIVAKGHRGAVLIDPDFATSPGIAMIKASHFDTIIDIRDLTSTIYEVVTQQPAQIRPSREFNPVISPILDETLQKGIKGEIKGTHSLKRQLVEARRTFKES